MPSIEANVAAAWRRGRRMRAQRLAVNGLAVVALVAIASIAAVNVFPNERATSPVAPATTLGLECSAPSTTDDIPPWAESANPPRNVPHLLSVDGNVVAILFGDPLWAAPPADKHNKILWIVRQPREGRPLEITARLPHSNARPVHVALPADSSPGEIYPSTINVPTPGCWHLSLEWNGNISEMNLSYGSVTPKVPTVTTTTPTTTNASAPTTCRTANLTLALSPPNGTAGHINYEIAFRNDSGSTCVMTGYPGVSFVDAAGRQTGAPAQRNPLQVVPVSLAPGATASAHLAVDDLGNPPCSADAHQIRVYPPNETASALITIDAMRVCGTSYIDPIVDRSTN